MSVNEVIYTIPLMQFKEDICLRITKKKIALRLSNGFNILIP
jgi:hypothetical protein